VLCSELFDDVELTADTLSFENEEDIWTFDLGNLWFVFYHELAHAVIDQLNLPVVGGEEAAADQFATVTLATNGFEHIDRTLRRR
jgi:hypothetical protein